MYVRRVNLKMIKIVLKILLIIFIVSIESQAKAITIDVKTYGAEVNDGIDDYDAIQKAITALDAVKNGKLIFHRGVYNINQHKIDSNIDVQKTVRLIHKNRFKRKKEKIEIKYLNNINVKRIARKKPIRNFTFKNYTSLIIEGNGATLEFDGNWIRTADYTLSNPKYTYSRHNAIGIEVINSKHVLIRNLELNGNSDETVKIATTEGFSEGIMIGGSSYVQINNVYVHHYQADGLYLYATKDAGKIKKSDHIKILNSRFKYNARQGCSIVGARYVDFDNCSFSNTGNSGMYGSHFPMAGVDIEPHEDVKGTGNVNFYKCNFNNNLGFAYVGSNAISTPYPVAFKYCTFSNSNTRYKYAAVVPSSRKTNFTHCFFNEISIWPNYGTKDKNGHVEVNVSQSKFKSRKIGQMVLLAIGNKNLRWRIEKCSFQLNATDRDNTKHRFYIANNKYVVLKSNTIEMSKEEYLSFRAKPYTKFILRNSVQSSNRWTKKTITPDIKNTRPTRSKYRVIYNNDGITILDRNI